MHLGRVTFSREQENVQLANHRMLPLQSAHAQLVLFLENSSPRPTLAGKAPDLLTTGMFAKLLASSERNLSAVLGNCQTVG